LSDEADHGARNGSHRFRKSSRHSRFLLSQR
jgi:hypothetical protein